MLLGVATQFGAGSAKFEAGIGWAGQSSTKFAWAPPNLARSRPNLARASPFSTKIGPATARPGRKWTNIGCAPLTHGGVGGRRQRKWRRQHLLGTGCARGWATPGAGGGGRRAAPPGGSRLLAGVRAALHPPWWRWGGLATEGCKLPRCGLVGDAGRRAPWRVRAAQCPAASWDVSRTLSRRHGTARIPAWRRAALGKTLPTEETQVAPASECGVPGTPTCAVSCGAHARMARALQRFLCTPVAALLHHAALALGGGRYDAALEATDARVREHAWVTGWRRIGATNG